MKKTALLALVFAALTAAHAADVQPQLQPFADATAADVQERRLSDAPFSWDYWRGTAPVDVSSLRGQMNRAEFIEKFSSNGGSSAWDEFDAMLETVYGDKITVYYDDMPCQNCTETLWQIVGTTPDGEQSGFVGVMFWDY